MTAACGEHGANRKEEHKSLRTSSVLVAAGATAGGGGAVSGSGGVLHVYCESGMT